MNRILCFITILVLSLSIFRYDAFAEEPLGWKACVREAAENHPDLISAQEEIVQSRADRDINTSGLFPRVTASVSGSSAKIAPSGADGSSSNRTNDTYAYGISGDQLLFDGLKTVNNIRAASEKLKASQQAYRFTSSDVRLRLRTAFVNMLRAQEMILVAEDIFKIREENLGLITLRYESGLEHKGALLTAEANLASARFEINQAKRDIEVARRQLIKEMGRVKFEPIRIKSDFNIQVEEEKPDFEGLINNNPALLQAIFQKNAAKFGLNSAVADFLPRISGEFSKDRTSSEWPPSNDNWSAGLTLSLPVFEGGGRNANLTQAKAVYRQLEADERSTKDAVILNLEETWQALQNSIETVNVQGKVLAAAQERSQIAEAQYSTGFLDYDNWTIIQDNLVNAKKNYLERRINTLLSEANWVHAKGETLEYVEKNN